MIARRSCSVARLSGAQRPYATAPCHPIPDRSEPACAIWMYDNGSMRVLDLGCGFGRNLIITRVEASDQIVGVDMALDRLRTAATKYDSRRFVQARAETLPFGDEAFRCIACQVAMPYMNIPPALGEIYRVLEPGGTAHISLHALRFTIHEIKVAFPRPKALAFRLWVLTNGLILHCTGKPRAFVGATNPFRPAGECPWL
jgi:ubiquinone/menaquinone biosynthesis C-methylase UbiE